VSAGYSDATRRILVANSDGVLATDEQVRTIFRVGTVADGDTGMQTGYDSVGFTIGFELFDEESIEELAERAARQAVTKLRARPAPSGAMPVVIKCGKPTSSHVAHRYTRTALANSSHHHWSHWSTTAP
jgi:TldD protein